MFAAKIAFGFFIQILCYLNIEAMYGRDWSVWTKTRRLIDLEISSRRALGLHAKSDLKDFDMFSYGSQLILNSMKQSMATNENMNVVNGAGVLMFKNKDGKIEFEIETPQREANTCGFLLSASFISNLTIFWKSTPVGRYDMIARPDNGLTSFDFNSKPDQEFGAIFFDSVPAKFFKFQLYPKSKGMLKLKIALINQCSFVGSHIITDCGEKLEKNKRFENQPFGVPISIRCPKDCMRTWPCWGYKIYSADSPICWTATQNFGRSGSGFYTIYKIKDVFYFRDQKRPALNHGVYCRKSITKYSGYTFDRKYYDFAESESKSLS